MAAETTTSAEKESHKERGAQQVQQQQMQQQQHETQPTAAANGEQAEGPTSSSSPSLSDQRQELELVGQINELRPLSEITFEERLREAIVERRLARQRKAAATTTTKIHHHLDQLEIPSVQQIAHDCYPSNELQPPKPFAQAIPSQDSSSRSTQAANASKISAELQVSQSYPIYNRAPLAPTASAPLARQPPRQDGAVSSSKNYGSFAFTSQRRKSRFEPTSLKLNRFLESGITMLPEPDLARMARQSTTTTRARRRANTASRSKSSADKRRRSAPIKYATREPPLPPAFLPTNDEQQMTTTDQADLQARQDHSQHYQTEKQQHHHDEQHQLDRSPSVSRETSDTDDSDTLEEDEDRDVDGGYAWVVLAVMFAINASTFGTARAYGLIFDKLARKDDQTRAEAALPFTIMGAIENMAGPLAGCLLARTSSWRLTVFVGSCLVTLAHLLAALTSGSQLGQLLSMGILCGLGMSFVFISFFQVNNAYFVRYRNTAFGIGMTGAAFGTLYISPLCQYFLDNYEGTGMCYLMLGLIIAPNVPMSLLLKPKQSQLATSSRIVSSSRNQSIKSELSCKSTADQVQQEQSHVSTISERIDAQSGQSKLSVMESIKLVIKNPLFHLIWPTQLLFCWFNFVFGMIIVDFGKDRGMDPQDVSNLIPIWAFGQLIGRLVLSTLVDLKFLSYRSFTVVCFGAISITTYALNNTRLNDDHNEPSSHLLGESSVFCLPTTTPFQQHLTILILVLVLSMFIALLYILLNGLIVNYVEQSLQPLSIGISSFTGSFFLLPRAYVIGYYRDNIGNYDAMLTMFAFVSLCAALTWLIVPTTCKYLRKFYENVRNRSQSVQRNNVIAIMTPYSTWRLEKEQP